MTSSRWIKLPPILKLNPRSQRISKTIITVQSIVLLGQNIYDATKDAPYELQDGDFCLGHNIKAVANLFLLQQQTPPRNRAGSKCNNERCCAALFINIPFPCQIQRAT
jgi:hypothetical protein